MASLNAAWAAVTAAVTRDARDNVTSAMFTEAKPTPAVTAKTKVMIQTAQPAAAVTRWQACQWEAAQAGMTSATRSAATPMARNSNPATSLDPSDRANQPFMVMPTTASANADAVNRIEAKRGRDSVTTPEATVGGGTGVTAVTFSHPDRGRGYLRNDRRDTGLLVLAIRAGALGAGLGLFGLMQDPCGRAKDRSLCRKAACSAAKLWGVKYWEPLP